MALLNEALSVRMDSLLNAWLSRMAAASGRTKGAFCRDLLFLLAMDEKLSQALIQRLKSDQISYTK